MEVDEFKIPASKEVGSKELKMAESLIESMSGKWEPEKYHDEYRERFLAMIDQKVKGEEITVAPPAPERGRGKVVDIFAALKQSLEQAAPKREAAEQRGRTKPARKRRKA